MFTVPTEKQNPKQAQKPIVGRELFAALFFVAFLCKSIVMFGQRLLFDKCACLLSPTSTHQPQPPPWRWESRMSSQKTAADPPGVGFPGSRLC